LVFVPYLLVHLCTESIPYSISSPVAVGTKCSIPNILWRDVLAAGCG
jgi:hypothetical protein